MKLIFCALFLSFAVAMPAAGQVIQIDSSGNSQTFDEPTVFNGNDVVPIRAEKPVTRSTLDSTNLLAAAARDHGLQPGLLEAVAWQESRGRMSAISPKGARGIMQLMPGTAAELGVRADDLADNIRGGALYLRRQLDRFGSVPLALAAYNAGPGAVLRYRGIPPYRETQGYVANIMGRWRPPPPNPSAISTPATASVNSLLIEVPTL